MAHVAHQGMSASVVHGDRRGKAQSRNFESMMGLDQPRRFGSRRPPGLRSQLAVGHPMMACRGLSVSSAQSAGFSSGQAAVTCNLRLCLRMVSVLTMVTGALMLACGLLLYPGWPILGLCIPGGLMIISVLVLWCVLYVWNGTYCIKSSGGALGTAGGTGQRPARVHGDEVTAVDLQLARLTSDEGMTSNGPDPHHQHHPHRHPSHPPPSYSPVDTGESFPSTGRSLEHPPSTPPPPYDEVT